MHEICLPICTACTHDILLDRLLHSDRLDSFIEAGLGGNPFGRGYDFDNAAFHSVRIDTTPITVSTGR